MTGFTAINRMPNNACKHPYSYPKPSPKVVIGNRSKYAPTANAEKIFQNNMFGEDSLTAVFDPVESSGTLTSADTPSSPIDSEDSNLQRVRNPFLQLRSDPTNVKVTKRQPPREVKPLQSIEEEVPRHVSRRKKTAKDHAATYSSSESSRSLCSAYLSPSDMPPPRRQPYDGDYAPSRVGTELATSTPATSPVLSSPSINSLQSESKNSGASIYPFTNHRPILYPRSRMASSPELGSQGQVYIPAIKQEYIDVPHAAVDPTRRSEWKTSLTGLKRSKIMEIPDAEGLESVRKRQAQQLNETSSKLALLKAKEKSRPVTELISNEMEQAVKASGRKRKAGEMEPKKEGKKRRSSLSISKHRNDVDSKSTHRRPGKDGVSQPRIQVDFNRRLSASTTWRENLVRKEVDVPNSSSNDCTCVGLPTYYRNRRFPFSLNPRTAGKHNFMFHIAQISKCHGHSPWIVKSCRKILEAEDRRARVC